MVTTDGDRIQIFKDNLVFRISCYRKSYRKYGRTRPSGEFLDERQIIKVPSEFDPITCTWLPRKMMFAPLRITLCITKRILLQCSNETMPFIKLPNLTKATRTIIFQKMHSRTDENMMRTDNGMRHFYLEEKFSNKINFSRRARCTQEGFYYNSNMGKRPKKGRIPKGKRFTRIYKCWMWHF